MSPTHPIPAFARRRSTQSVLAAMVVAALPGAAAAEAARVTFALGPVAATGTDGTSRTLARGAEIEPGDTIRTGTGRAQLRFTDGAYVSLKPDTEFRVDEYRFEGGNGGEKERGFFSLLRGGLRTITGLIGRARGASYRMHTPVATIGIRGTGYNLDLLTSAAGVQQLKWNVADGTISVQLADGTWLTFSQGGSGTANREQFEQILMALQQLADEGRLQGITRDELLEIFAAGDQVDAQGLSALLTMRAPPPDCTSAPNGCAMQAAIAFDGGEGYILSDGGESVHATFDAADGTLQSYTANGGGLFVTGVVDGGEGSGHNTAGQRGSAAAVVDGSAYFSVDPANPNDPRTIATWGRWIAPGTTGGDFPHPATLSGGDAFAYVLSIPTPQIPNSGVGTYNLVGFTPPAVSGPIAGMLGESGVVRGTLTANFGSSSVALDMTVPFANGNYHLENGGMGLGGRGSAYFGDYVGVTGTGVACGGESCDGVVTGNLFGPRADGAALGYQVKDSNSSITGASVFQQTSLSRGGILVAD